MFSHGAGTRNRRFWVSLCVSVVMLVAILTGVYSTMIEPTQTSIVTSTRTTYTRAEITYVYTMMGITTVRTITSSFSSCFYGCASNYMYYTSIVLARSGNIDLHTAHSVCILWSGNYVAAESIPQKSCHYELTRGYSVSSRSVTTTIVSSPYVQLPVTESHNETVPNPQKSVAQGLAVVLFIVGIAGLGLAIAGLGRSAPPRVETGVGGAKMEKPVYRRPEPSPSTISMPPRCPRCDGTLSESSRTHWFCPRCDVTIKRAGRGWELETDKRASHYTVETPPPAVSRMPSYAPPPVAEPSVPTRASTKFCRLCGAKIPRDSVFCEECGKKLT